MERYMLATLLHIATKGRPNGAEFLPKVGEPLPFNHLKHISESEVRKWIRQFAEPNEEHPELSEYFARTDAERLATSYVREMQKIAESGAFLITIYDQLYPPLLRFIPDPPLCITVIGDLERLLEPMVAVIGSRKSSHDVLLATKQLGKLLADSGLSVVSGGAFGIDYMAHAGVLESLQRPAKVVVVFPSGLRCLVPRTNRTLFQEIKAAGGLLLSERLMDDFPEAFDYPVRNRIISGLSRLTIAMDAGLKSGSITTCHHALHQGREVLIYKGAPLGEGLAKLEEEGAESFTTPLEAVKFYTQFLGE